MKSTIYRLAPAAAIPYSVQTEASLATFELKRRGFKREDVSCRPFDLIEIFAAVAEVGGTTIPALCAMFPKLSKRTIQARVQELVSFGVIKPASLHLITATDDATNNDATDAGLRTLMHDVKTLKPTNDA